MGRGNYLMCVALAVSAATAQDVGGRTLGAVTKVDTASQVLLLQSDMGTEVTISLPARATFRRVAPGHSELRNASTTSLANIGVGDRLLARGVASGVLVKINADSSFSRLQPQTAQLLAYRAQGMPERGRAGNGVSVDDVTKLIEQTPATTLAELKPGDAVVVSRDSLKRLKYGTGFVFSKDSRGI